MLYICDKTCKYFNNLRILLKRGLKPEWDRSRVRELTMLDATVLVAADVGTVSLLTLNSVFQCSIPTANMILVDNRLVHTSTNNTTVTPEFRLLVDIRTTFVTMLVVFHIMFITMPIKKKTAVTLMPYMHKMRVERELFTHCYDHSDYPIKMPNNVIDNN